MPILIIVALLGVVLLALDVMRLRKLIFPTFVIALLLLIPASIIGWTLKENIFQQNMIVFDPYALRGVLVLTAVALYWLFTQRRALESTGNSSDLFALLSFSFCGAILMTSFTNMVMLFLAIEILSIPLYVLSASKRGDFASNEAGFKYFLLGSMASAILLFGIALIYGATGSFDLYRIHDIFHTQGVNTLVLTGVVLMLGGFLFKISAAPFHFWAPDVYQGSPTPITAWMATVVKGAAIFGMFRLFAGVFESILPSLYTSLAWIVGITLVVSNIMAAVQFNVKRMMAYSGISHAGFLLATLLIPNFDINTLSFYVLVYGIASILSFVVIYAVQEQSQSNDLHAFKGLSKRNPALATALTLSLLSMAGIPPLAGFFSKYMVIAGIVNTYPVLAVVMVLTSVVGVYYYLKVIMTVYSAPDTDEVTSVNSFWLTVGGIALFALMALPAWL